MRLILALAVLTSWVVLAAINDPTPLRWYTWHQPWTDGNRRWVTRLLWYVAAGVSWLVDGLLLLPRWLLWPFLSEKGRKAGALALALLLTSVAPAAAVPIEIVATGLQAPACDWFGRLDLLIRDAQAYPGQLYPTIRPPCDGLEARVFFKPGEPDTFFFRAIYNPGRPNPDGTPTHITAAHAIVPIESLSGYFSLTFSLDALPDGRRSELWVSTRHSHGGIYGFTLERPKDGPPPGETPEPPLEATPEPATLLLMGTGLAVAGYIARKRGRR